MNGAISNVHNRGMSMPFKLFDWPLHKVFGVAGGRLSGQPIKPRRGRPLRTARSFNH